MAAATPGSSSSGATPDRPARGRQQPPVPQPSRLVRAWRAVRRFVSGLYGPDPAADQRMLNHARMHPRQDLRGRTFDGNY